MPHLRTRVFPTAAISIDTRMHRKRRAHAGTHRTVLRRAYPHTVHRPTNTRPPRARACESCESSFRDHHASESHTPASQSHPIPPWGHEQRGSDHCWQASLDLWLRPPSDAPAGSRRCWAAQAQQLAVQAQQLAVQAQQLAVWAVCMATQQLARLPSQCCCCGLHVGGGSRGRCRGHAPEPPAPLGSGDHAYDHPAHVRVVLGDPRGLLLVCM